MYKKYLILSLFLTALALRIFLIPNRGFEADIAFWKSWGLSALDNGVVVGIGVTNNNYPTPFSYLLGFLVFLYRLFADPHIFNDYWNDGNTLFLLIAKLPSILSDLGIAGLMLWIGSASAKRKQLGFPAMPYNFYILLAALYLFNPIALIDGALWGQVDSLGVFVFLCSVLLVTLKKPVLGGAVYTLSMMTKLQNMIYGPLFFLFVWQMEAFPGLVKSIMGGVAAFFFLNIEFLLKKNMSAVMESLTSNYDYFPLMSLNAFNLWWIVAKAQGMQTSDKLLSVGIINAKTTGLLLFSSGYLMAVITMAKETLKEMWQSSIANRLLSNRSKKMLYEECGERTKFCAASLPLKDGAHGETANGTEDAAKFSFATKAFRQPDASNILFHFFTALTIVAFSFFLFQTESHDRYAFPACVFLLFWGLFYVYRTNTEKFRMIWWTSRTFQIFIVAYITFSALFFLNLHTALAYNYPQNSIPALLFLRSPSYTILLSVLQITVFAVFLYIARHVVRLGAFLITLLFFLGACFFLNLPLITKSPVSLTKLTPYISQQGFGGRVTNMPVNAGGVSKNWNRLSVQYSFYKKGIGTHAASYFEYDLNKQFTRFTTDMGIDTEAGPNGSVVFKIYGDGKLLYQSDIVKRFEYPRHAEVNITGVKKFALIVEDGGDGIYDDHADWLNPMLFP